ncbi:family 16 glycosylhydrolase [Kribbella sp. NPDC048928]|uniref:glycoside hydrolase family 16 protein n=1 Tax=Kribbella sp. NPDC048928 TaxID=3364111 RepID=UPI003720A2D8
MRKLLTALVALGLFVVPLRAADAADTGEPGKLVFADEFDGTAVDRAKWAIHSNAEGDQCLGNKGNEQLEWHTWDALSVSDGKLTMTARKNNPASGYEWSGALITTGQACGHDPSQAFAVQPGDYVETRLKLPAAKGFWPSTWTWNGSGSNEQDTYEFYSDNHQALYLTNHQTGGGQCAYQSPTDLTADWHTIAEQLGPDETVWYLDGKEVCRQGAYAGSGALILDLFVYSKIPPEVTSESMQVDYVHVYRP